MSDIQLALNAKHFAISYCSAAKLVLSGRRKSPSLLSALSFLRIRCLILDSAPYRVARREFVVAARMTGGRLTDARCAAKWDVKSPRA